MRKVEVQLSDGTWMESAHDMADAIGHGIPARYVGGVLEQWSNSGIWISDVEQSQTLEEARAASQCKSLPIRLRPYEDGAPTAPDLTAHMVKMVDEQQARLRKMVEYPEWEAKVVEHAANAVRQADGGIATQMAELADAAAQAKTTADQFRDAYRSEAIRANRLSDECGALRTERDELLRENAVLRRKCERLERKVKR